MHLVRPIIAFLCCLAAVAPVLAAPDKSAYTIESPDQVEMDFETGVITLTNGVVVKYGDAVLTARRATLNQNTGDIWAEGNVQLESGGHLWRGETLQYNFVTRKVLGTAFKTGQPPYFIQGETLAGNQNFGVYAGAKARVTTDDVAQPGHWVRAKSIVVVPGEYVVAKHATLYVGKVPVFYYPYYRRNLDRTSNQLTLTPGYRNSYGSFINAAYHWYWSEQLDATLHLDARSERGIGFGPDVHWQVPRFGEGTLKYYYLDDQDPGVDTYGQPVDSERQRLWLTHQGNLASNLTVKAALRYQSDPAITRDFYEIEYRRNAQPITFLELNRAWQNFSLDLLVQPRVNDFFDTIERLPDLKLTGWRQQIGATPLYYESDSSLGWYRHQFADDFTNAYSAWRADTYHQVVLPHTFFNWLNVTPRVGSRYTHYGEADLYGQTIEEQDRWVFNTGAEVSFKLSRVWPYAHSRLFSLNGLRHIIEPSFNYVWVPEPNRTPRQLPPFDYAVPTTRLLPIDYPDYNAIDSIDSQNVLRLGLRNRLQTKRGAVDEFVNWALYTDWRLRPQTGQGTFSDFYSDLELRPFPWLTLHSGLRFDLDENRWDEINHTAIFVPNTRWNVMVGHRRLEDDYTPWYGPGYDQYLGTGYNLLYDRLAYRLNENWSVLCAHYYNVDDGLLQEQAYSLCRDFRSWTAALSFRIRESHDAPTDFGVAFTFCLKAFPRYGTGDSTGGRPSTLMGY